MIYDTSGLTPLGDSRAPSSLFWISLSLLVPWLDDTAINTLYISQVDTFLNYFLLYVSEVLDCDLHL